jgi:hypothetical protein
MCQGKEYAEKPKESSEVQEDILGEEKEQVCFMCQQSEPEENNPQNGGLLRKRGGRAVTAGHQTV